MTNKPSSTVFADESNFSADHLPEELPERDEQLQELFGLFRSVVRIPRKAHQQVVLLGPIRSGKATIARYFMRSLCQFDEAHFAAVHLNCQKTSSPSRLLTSVIQKIDPHFPTRGFSPDELLLILAARYSDLGLHLILCLDDFDSLLAKQAGKELLYSLVRLSDDSVSGKMRLSLLLVTNNRELPAMVDASIWSTLKYKQLYLPAYTVAQVEAILTQRASIGLNRDGVEKGVLSTIARTVAQLGGGARDAIEFLWHAGKTADSHGASTIGPHHLAPQVQWREVDALPEDYLAFT